MKSQTELIKQHLLLGKSINPLQALASYGCFRLGARIFDLRKQGLIIQSVMVRSGKKRFAKYFVKRLDN